MFDESEASKLQFPKNITELTESHGHNSLSMDPAFGESWELANVSGADLDYLVKNFNSLTAGLDPEAIADTVYGVLVMLNPKLKDITANGLEDKLHVIRGVASGLHFNDIKYFVQDLQGHGGNESRESRQLTNKAWEAYYGRKGEDFTQGGFILSFETATRMINNDPYP